MKKIILLGLVAGLWAGMAWGQYGYQYVSGGYWFGAQFIGQEGWMVGTTGQVAHTKDGGRTWQLSLVPWRTSYPWGMTVPTNLTGVSFVDQRHGWICDDGTSQYLWRTTNGGTTWEIESLAFYRGFTSKIAFGDTLQGWLTSGNYYGNYGQIAGTNDGGRTWAIQDASHCWFGIYAFSQNQCWAVGDSGWTGRTTDGGTNWIKQQVFPGRTLYDVFFPDTLFGWACGDSGTIVFTPDGGVSWTFQASGIARELVGITFLDRMRGFVVGDSGTLLRTTNGGTNWASLVSGVSATLSDITFGDSLHGWVIGEGGTTLETSDGGFTWSVTRRGTTDRLQAVSFVDDQTGWASSWEGNIWHTEDGGKAWVKQDSIIGERGFDPIGGRLKGLTMANSSTGWAVGDSLSGYYEKILGTRNGGSNWERQMNAYQYQDLKGVFASDGQHAWACGNQQRVIGTSNGGQTWNEQYLWPDTTVYDITFCDSSHGWALFQDGPVLRTKNTGQTWEMAGDVGMGSWYHLNFVDSLWGWAAGDSGVSLSTDGGKSWIRQNSGVTDRLWDVNGVSRMRAWAVGDNEKIVATTNGGATWIQQSSPVATTWRGVDFVDSLRGSACGQWSIINTTDGGVTWVQRWIGVLFPQAITMVDTLECWAVGNELLLHTTDGGMTWSEDRIASRHLRAVTFLGRDEGWVGGGAPNFISEVRHTTDRGNTWSAFTVTRLGEIYALGFADNARGWFGTGASYCGGMGATTDGGQSWKLLCYPRIYAIHGDASSSQIGTVCGSNGLLLRTTDGSTWERVMGPTTRNLWGIGFGDQQTGWAVGSRGVRLGTTDQGLTWQIQRDDNSADSLLMSVQGFDGLTARSTGYLGRSYLTTDGGTTWQGEETGTKEWLLASSFLTPTLGWVVGENGMVLKYGRLPYGVEEGEKTPGVPRVTWLGPNHPNPFTGGTEIRYQLANKGKVKLVVYNVLGQMVRRVIDKDQEPGTYGVTWDGRDEAGRNASSGVYFYRLEASEKCQTRKMVKIR